MKGCEGTQGFALVWTPGVPVVRKMFDQFNVDSRLERIYRLQCKRLVRNSLISSNPLSYQKPV